MTFTLIEVIIVAAGCMGWSIVGMLLAFDKLNLLPAVLLGTGCLSAALVVLS